ncbi:hypothetical protein J2Y39_003668 [Pseudomonas sp. 2957]|jgi:hypothetical protein|uniref:Uncharacterized protein n=1 Tax=Pseudomonas fluorescens TaxID=294 RepID=A0A5E7KKV2_PSEFL|nr:hypothetical protein [Pseudomonas sp. 2957]VVP02410.1 hypothetical protein PS847_02889 [Pseudomonas fluorescens]VVP50180.1 hypothetical protein PS865_05328 [Pseudomonas fluorescens]
MAGPAGYKTAEGFATDGKMPKVFGTVVSFTYNNK